MLPNPHTVGHPLAQVSRWSVGQIRPPQDNNFVVILSPKAERPLSHLGGENSGLPLASLISDDHIFSMSMTTSAGMGM